MFSQMSIHSQQSRSVSIIAMPEQQIQGQYEIHHQQIKGFIDSFEAFKDLFKKYHSSLNNFASNLSDVSKRDRSASDQPQESINCQLVTFLGLFASNIKSIASHTYNQLEAIRSRLEGVKEFKAQMKKNYEDQNKQYQKLKKEYQQSKDKMDDIKLKIDDFRKLSDHKDPQYIVELIYDTFQLLKHEYKYASHEVKARSQNKLECNRAFQTFMLNMIVEKDNLLENYILDSSERIESNFKCFRDTLSQSLNKLDQLVQIIYRFETFLRPLVQEISSKVSEQARLSQSNASQDQSLNNESSYHEAHNQRTKSAHNESKVLLNVSNSIFAKGLHNMFHDVNISRKSEYSNRSVSRPKIQNQNRFDPPPKSATNSSMESIALHSRVRNDISQKTTISNKGEKTDRQSATENSKYFSLHDQQHYSSQNNESNGSGKVGALLRGHQQQQQQSRQ